MKKPNSQIHTDTENSISIRRLNRRLNLRANRHVVCMILLGLFLVVGFGNACDHSSPLVPLDTVNLASTVTYDVQVNFCAPPPQPQKMYLKTVIVLDHSGSNAQNYKMASDGSGAPDISSGNLIISPLYATDPKGLTRYGTPTNSGTLLNYLNNLSPNDPADPTRFFALVDFNSSANTYPAGSTGFTSNIADFYNHVYTDAGAAQGGAPNDSGGTSYLAALTAAYNIVANDVKNAKACAALAPTAAPTPSCPKPGVIAASSYVVVFMSDGSPIINIAGVGTNSSGNIVITGPIVLTKESTTDILGQVGSIVNLQADDKYVASVNFFTIYYYSPGNVDTSGQTILAQMAKAGSGLAYNALSGSNIDYNQFQPPQKVLQYSLSDIFVTNANAVWWTDGKFHQDSDGDGLPDDIETAWGSDPQNPSTDGNGVSDLVKYQLNKGAACVKKNVKGICQDPVTNYTTGLCSGVKYTNVGGKIKFASSDPSGLNDCEKILLNDQAGIGAPDSNQDSIPDWLEFINNVPFQSGTTPAVTTVNQDGYTTYQKIKTSLPVSTPLNILLNLVPAVYNLAPATSPGTQSCYNLNVSNFPALSSSNKVRVDVIMKSNLVKDSYLYKVGFKAFGTGNSSVIFNDWNDPLEITNKTWSSWP